jgi:hypothetical protein
MKRALPIYWPFWSSNHCSSLLCQTHNLLIWLCRGFVLLNAYQLIVTGSLYSNFQRKTPRSLMYQQEVGTVPTVVQRPPDIAPKNTENESRKLHNEYTQGNV